MPRVDMDREHFDRASLLRLLDDDLPLLKVVLSLAGDLEKLISALGIAIRNDDMQSVKAASHKLKGAALGLAFRHLAGLAKRMEEGSGTHQEGLLEIHREMMSEWAELEPIIEAELH